MFINLEQCIRIQNTYRNLFTIITICRWAENSIKIFESLVNLAKGDLKIVGVRPISKQYLNLYNEEFRKIRINYKPGLVPPYYADMPKNLSEIIESEKKYLDEYDRNEIKTDVKYFFKAFNNIVIKKERSA